MMWLCCFLLPGMMLRGWSFLLPRMMWGVCLSSAPDVLAAAQDDVAYALGWGVASGGCHAGPPPGLVFRQATDILHQALRGWLPIQLPPLFGEGRYKSTAVANAPRGVNNNSSNRRRTQKKE